MQRAKQPFWKGLWYHLLMLNVHTPYDPAILSRRNFAYVHQEMCTQMLTAALLIIIKKWKQTKYPSTDEWTNEMWYIHLGNVTEP